MNLESVTFVTSLICDWNQQSSGCSLLNYDVKRNTPSVNLSTYKKIKWKILMGNKNQESVTFMTLVILDWNAQSSGCSHQSHTYIKSVVSDQWLLWKLSRTWSSSWFAFSIQTLKGIFGFISCNDPTKIEIQKSHKTPILHCINKVSTIMGMVNQHSHVFILSDSYHITISGNFILQLPIILNVVRWPKMGKRFSCDAR